MKQWRCAGVLFVLVSIFGTARAAWSWSDPGHQIVCALAVKEMKASTRTKINKIMATDTQYNTFWESCIWPDHPKKRRPEHFINAPRNFTDIHTDTCPEAATCLFTAIAKDSAVLSNPHASKTARLQSLKYLGHWMGDLHQPLHVSFLNDTGGNAIKSKGLCTANLHSDWDRCLVSLQLGNGNPFTIAQKLKDKISDADRTKWKGSTVVAWATESYQIAIASASHYCVEKDNTCQYDATHKDLEDGEQQKTVTIDQDYVDTNGAIVIERIKMAGVRLAKLLDDLLANQ